MEPMFNHSIFLSLVWTTDNLRNRSILGFSNYKLVELSSSRIFIQRVMFKIVLHRKKIKMSLKLFIFIFFLDILDRFLTL